MFGFLGAIGGGAWKGVKAIATGNTQSKLGLQSPHLPGAIVRLGRFWLLSSGSFIVLSWYTVYVNERTKPGSGPMLLLPPHKVISPPDRPDPKAKWAQVSKQTPGGATGGVAGNLPGSGKAGGFLPRGAMYKPGRADQGRDGQTNPGGPIIAPGNGYVVRIGSDPSGFGPDYPIVKFTSGPYNGRTIYIGHTHAVVHQGQSFHQGDILSYTGKSGVGNATVPGWFEIGFADGGSPGPFGQPTPF